MHLQRKHVGLQPRVGQGASLWRCTITNSLGEWVLLRWGNEHLLTRKTSSRELVFFIIREPDIRDRGQKEAIDVIRA